MWRADGLRRGWDLLRARLLPERHGLRYGLRSATLALRQAIEAARRELQEEVGLPVDTPMHFRAAWPEPPEALERSLLSALDDQALASE